MTKIQMNRENSSSHTKYIASLLGSSLLTMMISFPAFSQTTAQEGITRLEDNISNSKENIKQYKNNLDIVDANLKEVKKAQDQVQAQAKKLQDQINAHQQLMKKWQTQEKELNQLMVSEKEKNLKDEQRLKEIEKLVLQMKTNMENREKN
ncbi:MAG: hypothetical protein ACK5WZ_04715, partial [Pseudobdellovibrionaceae bacterium]